MPYNKLPEMPLKLFQIFLRSLSGLSLFCPKKGLEQNIFSNFLSVSLIFSQFFSFCIQSGTMQKFWMQRQWDEAWVSFFPLPPRECPWKFDKYYFAKLVPQIFCGQSFSSSARLFFFLTELAISKIKSFLNHTKYPQAKLWHF